MEIWSSVEIFSRSEEKCWRKRLLLLKFFLTLANCRLSSLISYSARKLPWNIHSKSFERKHFKFSIKIFSQSVTVNRTKWNKLSSLESQIPIYVGMCTQNYKTYKIAYLTVDSFNLLNYFAWKTLPFFISHSNMAQESVTESDKENIIAIMNHLNKWIRLTFPSFGSDHPSVFPLRLLQGDSIFNMSFFMSGASLSLFCF